MSVITAPASPQQAPEKRSAAQLPSPAALASSFNSDSPDHTAIATRIQFLSRRNIVPSRLGLLASLAWEVSSHGRD